MSRSFSQENESYRCDWVLGFPPNIVLEFSDLLVNSTFLLKLDFVFNTWMLLELCCCCFFNSLLTFQSGFFFFFLLEQMLWRNNIYVSMCCYCQHLWHCSEARGKHVLSVNLKMFFLKITFKMVHWCRNWVKKKIVNLKKIPLKVDTKCSITWWIT